MDVPVPNPAGCEVRSVIRFLNAEKLRPVEIHRRLTAIYGNIMNERNVRKWYAEFSGGRTNVHDEEGRGRRSSVDHALLARIEAKLREDRRVTVRDLTEMFPEVGKSTMQTLLTVKLGYRKVCARWVPIMLTEVQKVNRMESSQKFFDRFNKEGDEFLDSIVTGDETWVYHSTPESKQQFMTWRHPETPRVKKFRQAISAKKVMGIVEESS